MSPLLLALLVFLAPASTFAAEKMSPEDVQKLALQYADLYGVPHGIVLRTVKRESRFDPGARNGPYWGLMQIRYDTAKGVGYRGTATGLLDPATNLTYGVAYLANAYMIAGGNESMTHRLYRSGYYYAAKRKKLLAKLITAPPMGSQPVLVASTVRLVDGMPADEAPIPAPKPTLVAEADVAPAEAEAPVAVPLPIAKPKIALETPAAPPEPIVAKPQVVLASVLPEPHLSLGFGRDPAPATAAAMAIAAQMEPAVAEDPAVGVPLPRPNPLLAAAADPSAEPQGPDFSASYFDVAVKILPPMPVPRPRPVLVAEAAPAATMVASIAAPRPKPRPAE